MKTIVLLEHPDEFHEFYVDEKKSKEYFRLAAFWKNDDKTIQILTKFTIFNQIFLKFFIFSSFEIPKFSF